jgi:hypothetical protein
LVVELGIVGLVLWIVMGVAIVGSTWTVVLELRGTPWFPIAFTVFLYAAILLFPLMFVGASSYQDYVLNADFWLFVGILYRIRVFPKMYEAIQTRATSGAV